MKIFYFIIIRCIKKNFILLLLGVSKIYYKDVMEKNFFSHFKAILAVEARPCPIGQSACPFPILTDKPLIQFSLNSSHVLLIYSIGLTCGIFFRISSREFVFYFLESSLESRSFTISYHL